MRPASECLYLSACLRRRRLSMTVRRIEVGYSGRAIYFIALKSSHQPLELISPSTCVQRPAS